MSAKITYNWLNILEAKNLVNWSASWLLQNRVSYNKEYTLMSLRELLKRNNSPIVIEDDKLYTRVTVRNYGRGIVERDKVMGKDIGTKRQFKVNAGEFLISKIDARNGSFGIIPDELQDAIVTQDFLPYKVNTKLILPRFLQLLTVSEPFYRFCQSASSGTTNRQRISEILFLNIQIPIPSIPKQQALLDAYNAKIAAAKRAESEANEKEAGIESYLLSELGVEISKKEAQRGKLHLINSNFLKRWDTQYLLYDSERHSSNYETKSFAELIEYFLENEKGSLRIDTSKFPEAEFAYIGMEHIQKDTGILLQSPKVKGSEIKSQTVLLPKGYFLYGKLRPYLNKYFFNRTEQSYICSSEFFAFKIHQDIDEGYFECALASEIIQEQIANQTSGARMPRINEKIFKQLSIPLPPIVKQKEIAEHIEDLKTEISRLRKKAKQGRESARADFESALFTLSPTNE